MPKIRITGAGYSSVPEAPYDGQQYARINGEWEPIISTQQSSGNEPPTDANDCTGSCEDGESAYEIARRHGYVGTEEEWLAEIQNTNQTIYGGNY